MADPESLIINRTFPENKQTLNEFLDDVLTSNNVGTNLLSAEPRWAMAFNPENEKQEDFEKRCIINPGLFQTPGIRRDQEQNMYSDADPDGHLKIVGMLANDYNNTMMFNEEGMLRVLDSVNRKDLPKILTLSSLFHDYHEGNPEIGDRVGKDKDFKLKEVVAMYTDTLQDLKRTYRENILKRKELSEKQKKELINKNDLLFEKTFLTLAADPKLSEKYNISKEDIKASFEKEGLNISGFLDLLDNPMYLHIADVLEMLHQISFLMSSISLKEKDNQDITTKALKFEACTRSAGELREILSNSKDPYLANFLYKNRDEIVSLIETGHDINIQRELVRNGRNIINPNNFLND